jgi:NADH-quinone oxidoreductase subunit C
VTDRTPDRPQEPDRSPGEGAEEPVDEKVDDTAPADHATTEQASGATESSNVEESVEQVPEKAPEHEGITERMPENAPPETGAPETRVEVVEVRKGMFGARGTGDTSGYGGLRRAVAMPGSSSRPFGGDLDVLADSFDAALHSEGLDDAIEKVVVHRGEITFYIRRQHLLRTVQQLRDDAALRFELCSGVSGVHYPEDTGRELHAVYHLLSMTHNRRIRVEVACPDADPHIPSVVAVYPTADWHERETYDFFGIIFDGHPALTRIEMPDDWPGHPQRKDYPLGGIPVEYKGATIPPPDQRRAYN